jgi:hypothetical protein
LGTGQSRQNSQNKVQDRTVGNRTIETGQPEQGPGQDSWDRTGQIGGDGQNMEGKTGHRRKKSWGQKYSDRTLDTGQPGKDSQDRNDRVMSS